MPPGVTQTLKIFRTLFKATYRLPPPNPPSRSAIFKVGQAPRPVHLQESEMSTLRQIEANRRNARKSNRPRLCNRQSRLFHERPQNRHPRQVPHPPHRETRRSRRAHRRVLPAPPARLPGSPPPGRRSHHRRLAPRCGPPKEGVRLRTDSAASAALRRRASDSTSLQGTISSTPFRGSPPATHWSESRISQLLLRHCRSTIQICACSCSRAINGMWQNWSTVRKAEVGEYVPRTPHDLSATFRARFCHIAPRSPV